VRRKFLLSIEARLRARFFLAEEKFVMGFTWDAAIAILEKEQQVPPLRHR
jgi:hypothetical protein